MPEVRYDTFPVYRFRHFFSSTVFLDLGPALPDRSISYHIDKHEVFRDK